MHSNVVITVARERQVNIFSVVVVCALNHDTCQLLKKSQRRKSNKIADQK